MAGELILSNGLSATTALAVAENASKSIFKNLNEQKEFLKYVVQVYSTAPALANLDPKQTNAVILQLYLKNADVSNGEGFVIGYKSRKTGQTVAAAQTGYKYAIKKLGETGEFKEGPTCFPLYEGELKDFKVESRDVVFETMKVLTFEDMKKRREAKRIGGVAKYLMMDGTKIEKFFFEEEIEEHTLKYSDGYKDAKSKGDDAKGIGITNRDDMFKKTALMRVYAQYVPKTPKISQAMQDVRKLNFTTFNEMAIDAKPEFVDNPDPVEEPMAIEQVKVRMFDDLGAGEKGLAGNAKALKAIKDRKERTKAIAEVIKKAMEAGVVKCEEAKFNLLTADEYLNIIVPSLESADKIEDIHFSLDEPEKEVVLEEPVDKIVVLEEQPNNVVVLDENKKDVPGGVTIDGMEVK